MVLGANQAVLVRQSVVRVRRFSGYAKDQQWRTTSPDTVHCLGHQSNNTTLEVRVRNTPASDVASTGRGGHVQNSVMIRP